MQTLQAEHNYCAAYFGDRPDWLIAAAQHRDSDVLTRSNFRTMRALLEAVDPSAVDVESSSHWAVGWVEYLIVRPDSTAATEVDRLRVKLDDYPVLDEEDWSELETEAAFETWQAFSLRDRVDYCKRYHVSIFAARRADELPDDPQGGLVQALAE